MKKKPIAMFFAVILALSVFAFAGFGCETKEKAEEEKTYTRPTDEEEEEEEISADYAGTWIRQATYADGELLQTATATLTIKEDDTFVSTAQCTVTGNVIYHGENSFTLSPVTSNCGPTPAVKYEYEIYKEGGIEKMRITDLEGSPAVTEIYNRQ